MPRGTLNNLQLRTVRVPRGTLNNLQLPYTPFDENHGALADCRTQERVWGLLVRGLYRHFKATGQI